MPHLPVLAPTEAAERYEVLDVLRGDPTLPSAGRFRLAPSLGVAVLPRRGVLVRCLAPSAPVLLAAIDECWRLARGALLGLPPLALRKA